MFSLGKPFENPQGKSIFIVRACAMEVLLACACIFSTKTTAGGGGGGATDSDKVSFYLLIHVKFT